MSGYTGEKKYTGAEKIVIGVDIGTTHSAVSFAYLYPDDVPRVRMVNKWPGQPESVGSSKIPSLVAYRAGQCKACGAEAKKYDNDVVYSVAKWFKLHLHPSSMKLSDLPPAYGSQASSSTFEVPPLPEMVSIEKVYTDFMKYLIDNTQVGFGQTIPNGEAVWRRLRSKMVVVLTTPNGWDFTQQSVLCKAAIAAGMVTEQNANDLLDFVTEGEASTHYALAYSQTKSWLRVNSVFAVIDAGDSTVDSTLYECKAIEPKVMLEEVCHSECIQAGGVFVDRAAESIFTQRFGGSHFGDDGCIADMVCGFEIRTRRLFDGNQNSCVVDFGSSHDTDRARGIIKGKLSMTKEEVCSAFDDVITRITDNCSLLFRGRKVQHILLAGSFGESAYLRRKLTRLFDAQGVKVIAVEEPAKKATAEGALMWYAKQTVLARTTVGVPADSLYKGGDPEHSQRPMSIYVDPAGLRIFHTSTTPMSGYTGEKRYTRTENIVVGMDIGTTHTAVSFAYLHPDDFARVRMVNKWPGQPESVGLSKIPTLVAYRAGQCKACGAEAKKYDNDVVYSVSKRFKLHLHPSSTRLSDLPPPYGSQASSSTFEVPPLPEMVSIEKVYTDFMKYLIDNTQVVFGQTIPNGDAVWRRLRSKMVVVLTTPNGWDFTQQNILRKAAIAAGMVTEQNANDLLEFVTEGEASVHYALAYSQTKSWLRVNSVFALIDAGHFTVDSTLYECKAIEPKVMLEEVCHSECIQAGGVFVDRAAEAIFKQKFGGSHFGDDSCIADMVGAFETRTKRFFDGNQASCVIDFGSSRDTDRARGIIKGKLSMTKEEVCSAFDDVIKRIMDNCSLLFTGRNVQHILLVGSFGETAYLQRKLAQLFDAQGVKVIKVEEPAKKVAAEGALIWYIKQTVLARAARTAVGVPVDWLYKEGDPEHSRRLMSIYVDPAGQKYIRGGFDALVPKGTRMGADFVSIKSYYKRFPCCVAQIIPYLGSFECTIEVWEGQAVPTWRDDANGHQLPQVRSLCILKADLSLLQYSLKEKGHTSKRYCEVSFRVAIKFEGTQLQARLQWEQNGALLEGPVSILSNAIV